MNQILLLTFIIVSVGVTSKNITIENKCDYTVWPGISNSYKDFDTNGFALKKGESRVIVHSFWSGAIWGRTLCSRNSTTGIFSCATGDCGSGEIECPESDQAPMNTTLAEFQLNSDTVDLYRINVVYGYNLPLLVVPQGMFHGIDKICSTVSCDVVNLNQACPYDLMVVDAEERPVACTNPCEAPDCMPSSYSESFKVPCPEATFDFSDDNYVACTGSTDYLVTFCPSFTPIPTRRIKSEPKIGTLGFTNKTTTEAKHDKTSPLKLKVILGISTTALIAMIIILAASTVLLRAKNARKESDWNGENIEAIVMLKRYNYAKVKKMTNSFSHVLGKGGFGTVYKGKLLDGSGTDVAVKILKDSKGNGEEFINEVASMSRTSHVNIVSLLGFCYEGNKRAIIYEFMPNGSLDKYISESMSTKMEWETLYNIAAGVARGLEYLHNRCVTRIVHFDIKPQNILMDQDLCPKIADFGLAKLCNKKESIISMLNARGTIGYIAPEVFSKSLGGVSHKSDVYSFGMVVLEIVGAKNKEIPEKSGSNNSSMYFPDWIYKDLEREETMKIFGDEMTEEEDKLVKKMVLVGLWCIQTNPCDRPSMNKAVEMLEGSLEALHVPPKPLFGSPTVMVSGSVEESQETSSQLERGSLLPCHDIVVESQSS